MNIRPILAAMLLFVTGPARAHDVWLTLDGLFGPRSVIVNYGHPGDRPPAAIDKVLDLVAVDSFHRIDLRPGLKTAVRGDVVVGVSDRIPLPESMLLAASYDNGFWVKTAEGYRNATRRLAGPVQESVWSGKFAKAIGRNAEGWGNIVGHPLEIVPLSAPATIAAGRSLKVRVLFRGQPLVQAEVERGDGFTPVAENDIPRFRTDSEGIATIPLVAPGATLLAVDHRVAPSQAPDQADADLYTATLRFETPTP